MFELLINNNNFSYLLLILTIINLFLLIINMLYETPTDLKKIYLEEKNAKIKTIITIIELIIFGISIYLKYKIIVISLILFFETIIFITKIIFKKDIYNLNEDNIYMHITFSIALVIIFNKNILNIILEMLNSLPHYWTEVTLILFIGFKIILLTFEIIMNILILITYIKKIIPKKQKMIFYKIENKINKPKDIYYKCYNFQLSNKKRLKIYYIIDCMIFSVLLIPTLLYNIIKIQIIKILIMFLRYIIKVINYFKNFYIYKTRNINNIMKILTIIAIIVLNIVIYTRQEIFSEAITNIYNLIATSILIPLFYDKIINKKINH